MELSVVIPVYNSARILPSLIEQIEAHVAPCVRTYEVLLVNDSSPDDSWRVIERLCSLHASVKGISLRKNAGQHNAIMAGLNYASGDVVVVMDDDLQHSPADICRLHAKVLEGYDVCFAKFSEVKHALWKRLGSFFNDVAARVLLQKPRDVYLSPFKAFTAAVKAEVIKYTGPHAYLDGLILMTTSNLTSVTVDHHPRAEGPGNYTLLKSIALWAKMATSFSILPLRIAGFLGVVMAAMGFLLALIVVGLRLFSAYLIPLGWTSLITAVLIIGGVQLLALGVIGEYLGRTYVRLNNVPQFSVKTTIKL